MSTPAPEWIATSTREELVDAAIWLQHDAAYLYRWAGLYRDQHSNYVAERVQIAARASFDLSRLCIDTAATRKQGA